MYRPQFQPHGVRTIRRACVPALALSVVALLAAPAIATPRPVPAATVQQTQTFGFTGGPQSFVVPPGVSNVRVTADGGSGGAGAALQPGIASGAQGLGGEVTANLHVTAGQTLA